MRLIPQLVNARPKLSSISISQEEITADLLYPSRSRRAGGQDELDRRRRRWRR